jgi:hypothetical protein
MSPSFDTQNKESWLMSHVKIRAASVGDFSISRFALIRSLGVAT